MHLRQILVPVDFTWVAEREIQHAVWLAERCGARLVLEHNLGPRPPGQLTVSWMWSEEHDAAERRRADRAERRLRTMLDRLPDAHRGQATLTRGPVDLALLQVARALPADLILMGSHGKSSGRRRSVTESVLPQSPCPVLTLGESLDRSDEFERLVAGGGSIVAALRGDRPEAVARQAFALARYLSADLVLLRVGRVARNGAQVPGGGDAGVAPDVPEDLAGRVAELRRTGEPAEEILRVAAERRAGLIVLGSKPSGRWRRKPGRTAHRVLHESPCPVWFQPHSP